MNTGIKIDHLILEYLLPVLNTSKTDMSGISCISEKHQLTELHALLEPQRIHAACAIKEFMDEMPGGFFIYRADEDEEVIYANTAFLRLFNCDTQEEFQELTGNSFKGIVHPDDLDAVEASIKEQIAISQYDLDYVEYRIIQKGGAICWVHDYGHFIHSETAGDYFYVFVGDATEMTKRQLEEKHRQEQELQQIHKEHLRRLEMIEGLSIDYESIFYVDLDTDKIQAYRVSPRFEKEFGNGHYVRNFTGFDADYINTWVCPEDRPLLSCATTPEYIRDKLSSEKAFHINYRIYKDGEPVYIQLHVVNIGNSEHISQIIIGYRNIDDEIIQELRQRQLLEETLNQAKLANKAKNLFLSNMSHDIRTPMNAIVGFASLAKSHINDREKVLGYLDMITSSSSALLQMLNNVFEVSRIESKQVHIEEDKCDLVEMIHNVHTSMSSRAREKSITFSLDTSQIRHHMVYCDQQKLSKVLVNIIDNALKYTKSGGKIEVVAVEQEQSLKSLSSYQFIVKDNGIGINQKFISHIFEPFERANNTTLSGIHGSGLGLTIARKIMDALGGTIDIASTVGNGSKFTVTLQLRRLEEQSASAQPNAKPTNRTPEQTRIMMVDDNEINLEIGFEVLRDAGYQVDTAADGSIALEKLKNSHPGHYDLILMDLQMPIMNGYDAARAIRELDNPLLANIPIVALSANTFDEDKKMTLQSGMNAHLGKPIDTPLLYETIEKILNETAMSEP